MILPTIGHAQVNTPSNSMNANSRNEFHFIVTVMAHNLEQAEQVIAERIDHDESYGFDYRIWSTRPPLWDELINS